MPQDLTAQHHALPTTLGMKANRIYVDHGLLARAETRLNPRSDNSLDDNCDDSCRLSDAAYTIVWGRSCLVTASARSWQCGGC